MNTTETTKRPLTTNVLNSQIKGEFKKLGFLLSLIAKADINSLPTENQDEAKQILKLANSLKKNETEYKAFEQTVRRTKIGNFNLYYTIQGLRKLAKV